MMNFEPWYAMVLIKSFEQNVRIFMVCTDGNEMNSNATVTKIN